MIQQKDKIKAIGTHVFAGGFTMGVQKVFDVVAQFERWDFGRGTVEQKLKIPFIKGAAGHHEWIPQKDVWEDCRICFGNPRCTGFSCITSGYSGETHGPWAKQCQDIHDLCHFGLEADMEFIIWESVQQAFTTGGPLLRFLIDDLFVPNHYRIAHVFINAATFGNPQHRKRYFFVAYKDCYKFNITPPDVVAEHGTVNETIKQWNRIKGNEKNLTNNKCIDYDDNSHARLTIDEWDIVPVLNEGECMNQLGHKREEVLLAANEKFAETWHLRNSPMPFSLHCLRRLKGDATCPTIHSSASRFVHPRLNRPITVAEMSALMGWPVTPAGGQPIAQIAKGIVPSVGTWLAEMVKLSLDDYWGQEDWESSYDDKEGEWVGRDYSHGEVLPTEKIFNTTRYAPARKR